MGKSTGKMTLKTDFNLTVVGGQSDNNAVTRQVKSYFTCEVSEGRD